MREPPRRLSHQPGLDGIRGIAIALVVCKHIGVLSGGFIGVDIFFVLSGFLITTLLLQERRSTGTVNFGAFYRRRVRRLLPALLIALPLGWVAATVYPHHLTDWPYWLGALGALGYVSNWLQVAGHDHLRTLAHTWSLAVEEQFYLVWPAALFALLRRRMHERRVLIAVAGVVVTSVLYLTVVKRVDPGHNLYVSTISRAGELLLGAGLCVLWRHRRVPRLLSSWYAFVAVAAGLGWLAWTVTVYTGWMYSWAGIYLGALAGVVLVATVMERPESWPARLLTVSPLRYTGRISYGMYLYNYPLSFALSAEVTGLGKFSSAALIAAATWAAAAASYHLVEQPILNAKPRQLTLLDGGRRLDGGLDSRIEPCELVDVGHAAS